MYTAEVCINFCLVIFIKVTKYLNNSLHSSFLNIKLAMTVMPYSHTYQGKYHEIIYINCSVPALL